MVSITEVSWLLTVYLQSVVWNRKLLFVVLEVGNWLTGTNLDPQELLKDLHATKLIATLFGHSEDLTWQSCPVPWVKSLVQKWSWVRTFHALGPKHEAILPFHFLISTLNFVFKSAYIWIIKHIYFYQEGVWNVRIHCSVLLPQAICGKAIAVFHR